MRFTLAQAEAFFWTAQLGSVSKTASHLHLAQPTVSLRLRDFERALGVALFRKSGRGLMLTADGIALVPRAAALLEKAAHVRSQPNAAEVSGSLKVGLAEGFAMIAMPALLEAVRRDVPRLRPEFVVATSFELERALNEHSLDLAVLVNPTGRAGIKLVPLGVQKTTWFAAPSWGLSGTIRPADLARLPIITNPPRSAMFRQIKDWFATAGHEPERLDVCSSVAVIAHLVVSGAALGVLPTKMMEADMLADRVHMLRPIPRVDSGKVYASYAEGGRTEAVNALLASINAVLAAMDYLQTGGVDRVAHRHTPG